MLSETVLALAVPVVLSVIAVRLWQVFIISTADQRSSLPLPPGGVGLPFIGETLSFLLKGQEFFTGKSRRHGRLYKTHILGRPTIRICGADNIHSILKAEEVNVTLQWPPSALHLIGPGSLMASKGELHRIRRDSVANALSSHAVFELLPIIQATIREHLSHWLARGTILAGECSRSLALDLAVRCLLGYECSQRDTYDMAQNLATMEQALFSLPHHFPGSPFTKGMEARSRVLNLMNKIILNKRENVNNNISNDILTRLLQLPEKYQLREEDVKDICVEMVFSSTGISGAYCTLIRELARHGHAVEMATNELHHLDLLETQRDGDLITDKVTNLQYISRVVKEVLRLTPPVGGGCRTVLRTIELNGYQIPRGWSVMYSIKDQHDPYTEMSSSRFEPDRWTSDRNISQIDEYLYIPFGGSGHRSCVGREFATLCLKILTAEIVRGYQWRLLESEPTFKYLSDPTADGMAITIREASPLRQRRVTV